MTETSPRVDQCHRHTLSPLRTALTTFLILIPNQVLLRSFSAFDPVIGKTVTAKYAGNLYHEIQHDNGDRYVVGLMMSVAACSERVFSS